MKYEILHKAASVPHIYWQKDVLRRITEILHFTQPFDKIVDDVRGMLKAVNEMILDDINRSLTDPPFVFTLTAFTDERKLFIANTPTGEDFLILQVN